MLVDAQGNHLLRAGTALSSTLNRPIIRLLGLVAATALAIGLLASSSSAGPTTKDGHGLLTVETSPQVASQITVGGVQRNSSLVRGLELPEGSYLVCVSEVQGYLSPPCETIEVRDGQTVTHVATFQPAGTLTVTTEPSGTGGMIVVNDIDRDRGTASFPVAAGEHVVCFGDIGGYESPDCQSINIAGGGSVSVTGSYTTLATEPSEGDAGGDDDPKDGSVGEPEPTPPPPDADPEPGTGGADEPPPTSGEAGDEDGRDQDDVGPPNGFTDVSEGVHRDAILRMAGAGVIAGYADGTFRPANHVTRGQIATLLSRAFDLDASGCGQDCLSLTDVETSTHREGINAVVNHGIASGYADGTFRPDRPVTRAQLASMLAATLGLSDELVDHPFDDVRGTTHEARIAALYEAGITKGSSSTNFSPQESTRRDQFATLLSRGIDAP